MNPLKRILLASSLALWWPALAHEMVMGGEVAGLLHVEPNDAPRVGQNVTVWFELTQKGVRCSPPLASASGSKCSRVTTR